MTAATAGEVRGSYQTGETSGGNAFGAWTSHSWTQTTQDDFCMGVLDSVNGLLSPGNVFLEILAPDNFSRAGSVASAVHDSGSSGTRWAELSWDAIIYPSTDIRFEVRTSDSEFTASASSPGWQDAGDVSPVTSGLPAGRYKQWRAILTTDDPSGTPILQEVRISYF